MTRTDGSRHPEPVSGSADENNRAIKVCFTMEESNVEPDMRRSGLDRRVKESEKTPDKRASKERRVAIRDAAKIIAFMKTIPLFKGFPDEQYLILLNICTHKLIKKDTFICREGEESEELFVLVEGKLKVLVRESTLVNFIYPMGLVGEIGVFTNHKRSASVLAYTDCVVLRFHKEELFRLIGRDPSLSQRLLLNVINDIAAKLHDDNDIIEELRNKKSTMVL
jgi:CRP/FNR family transcriptional regulator, cyclic AMP receptor protein